jgi:putative oxidoreductase
MTATPAARTPPAASDTTAGRSIARTMLRWSVVALFAVVGIAKLAGAPPTVALFDAVGFGQWFRYVVGTAETVGACLLAYSPTALPGALMLVTVMVGAVGTELFILHRAPVSSVAALTPVALLLLTWRRPT